jgi:hypothetical protein
MVGHISDFYGGWVHKGIIGKMKGGESSAGFCSATVRLMLIGTEIFFVQHEAPSSGKVLTARRPASSLCVRSGVISGLYQDFYLYHIAPHSR